MKKKISLYNSLFNLARKNSYTVRDYRKTIVLLLNQYLDYENLLSSTGEEQMVLSRGDESNDDCDVLIKLVDPK